MSRSLSKVIFCPEALAADREGIAKRCEYQDVDLEICQILDVTQREEDSKCSICDKTSHGKREMLIKDSQCGATFCANCFLSRAYMWDNCAACKQNIKTELKLTFKDRQLIQEAEQTRLEIRTQLAGILSLAAVIKHEVPKHTSAQRNTLPVALPLPLPARYMQNKVEKLVASVMRIQYSYVSDPGYWMERTEDATSVLEGVVGCIKGTGDGIKASAFRRMRPQERADTATYLLKKAVTLLKKCKVEDESESAKKQSVDGADASGEETLLAEQWASLAIV